MRWTGTGRWGSAIALGTAGLWALACAGGEAEPEPAPEPVPAEPEPEPEHPLAVDTTYEAPADGDAQTLRFHDDGTCAHTVVNEYACTWEGAGEPGAWTAKITAYTSATTPAGETVDVDREAGAVWQVSDDGATLTADGTTLTRVDGEGDEGEDGADEGEDGADEGEDGADEGDASPTPRPARPRPTPKPGGAVGARPRDGGTADPAPKTGKGKGTKGAKPRPD